MHEHMRNRLAICALGKVISLLPRWLAIALENSCHLGRRVHSVLPTVIAIQSDIGNMAATGTLRRNNKEVT
jgi:hypothetical protein